ncbi:apoptotic chromatin condensation inducer in the nucleus-like isoform X1 [Myxocyprinus asiaticus]|uniref:apoptotic chromatin condensation inducer in the nucleus-like isoform X1 n=2 Tax=Myxocyprinus asiaticus TaxID=70543 RepID=UPI0022219433|nr:apoptotic chromatin condensation inducer in the nucleus-like isoform X1 [Myxocyprinus asiaticus]
MAELEDVTLDGKPLHSLRVADLKAALEQRGLVKSGQKNALIKRLKGALMLENLQRSSTHHIGLQPNSQIGEEMSQNSFIQQYLAKQQELLRQRLEREAREAGADDTQSPAGPEEEDDHSPTKDSTSYLPDNHHGIISHLSLTQMEGGGEDHGGGLPQDLMGSRRLDMGPAPVFQESTDSKAGRIRHPFLPSHEEVATSSPPRAVASLSVRVVGQPERQGLPLIMPRTLEREGTAPVEAGPAHSVLHLSRSARAVACPQVDSDEEDDDDSDEDDEWGPSSHGKKNVRAPPVHTPPAAAPQRSRRKLQPPQHIPPQPQPIHQPPLQLRQPTPPPSPPPELSFPLPDTPKQSPNDQDEPAGLGEGAAPGAGTMPSPPLKRQESSSSSRSSSPEPRSTRTPGPLSLLVHKMESEGVFDGGQKVGMEGDGKMEVDEQEDGEAAEGPGVIARTEQQGTVQKLRKPQVSVSVPTMPPAWHDNDSELEKERGPQREGEEQNDVEKEKEKVGKTSAPFHTTLPTTFPCKRPQMFSEVPPPESLISPSKPKQVSVLTTSPKCSEDVALETEASSKMTKSKHNEDDKEVKILEKLASLQSAGMTKENKKVLSSPLPSAEGETEKKRDLTRRGKANERHSSTSSQSSSSDSDSGSSSSRSSSSPSRDKSSTHSRKKDQEEKSRRAYVKEEKKTQSSREVKQETLSEPTGQVAMELESRSDLESAKQQSGHQGADASETHPEESSTAKSFAARKISLNNKAENASAESESVGGANRKRRWGSSTAVTAKKPSISITTESLKTLIPDIKPLQESLVELHPGEGRLSGDEDSARPHDREEPAEDQGLKIRRTVTQVVSSDAYENGQKEMVGDEDEEEQKWATGEKEKRCRKLESSSDAMETQEGNVKVTPNDSLVRRSISQQKSGVSITIDDPIRTGRQLSPPHGKTSNIIHICNLVRPFTLGQLKELLNRTGTLVEEGFWIDKIKSHCYVTYSSKEEAVATREALHGVKWPASNPKVLRVDFCEQDELNYHKGLVSSNRAGDVHDPQASESPIRPAVPPPLMPTHREKERERNRDDGASAVRDQWAERERAMERRERTRSEREWDRDKVKDFGREDRDGTKKSRSQDRDRRRRERGRSKEKRTEKKDKLEEPPAKLLDDLFHKTKAAPCIYWLPLTEEQATQRALERAERIKEREKRRKELQDEEDKKREERQEKAKGRDREGGNAGGGGGGGGGVVGHSAEGDRDRERERERQRGREEERRRDGHRSRGSDSKTAGGSRNSQSHSNISRDRRH